MMDLLQVPGGMSFQMTRIDWLQRNLLLLQTKKNYFSDEPIVL
jgi:hypothetical protein